MTSRLDRSATSVYSLCVSATDGVHTTSVNFNVTLHQPDDHDLVEFTVPFYVFDVAEDAVPGVTVGSVEAFLAVVGHQASSSQPTYVVLSRWASSVFRLNATYGILTLASTLDYETVSISPCCFLPREAAMLAPSWESNKVCYEVSLRENVQRQSCSIYSHYSI